MDLEKCENFLNVNGYIPMYDEDALKDGQDYQTYYKDSETLFSIDINDEEIVFIDDFGDFLHLPVNFYCLLGALIHYRQI